jgi:adenylate kinase
LGPQGSGKGTQAKRISESFEIAHVATGEMLRAAVTDGSELGRQVKPILARGDLVPDELMVDLIRERIEGEDGFVLDGFPRTLPQTEALDAMLGDVGKPLDVVLLLMLDDEVASERLAGRAAAEGRTDDAPAVIRRRLELYHEQTEPVVERYRTDGILVPIDADQSIGAVAADIDDALAHVGVRSR